ncbi:MAG TPA: hypothetical protein VH482_15380 [Thermomicrobiales bacterium]|jgi:hypothetical protein
MCTRRWVRRQPRHSTSIRRFVAVGLGALTILGTLAACGKETAKPTSTTTVPVTGSATAVTSTVTGSGLTVGTLADRIGAAWVGVTTYRAVTTTAGGEPGKTGSPAVTAASGVAGPGAVETIDEVVLPDRKHRLARLDGVGQYEVIAVGGKVYARGPLAPGLSPSRGDPDAWVAVDPAAFAGTPPAGEFYADLLAPPTAPYSGLSRQERARDAVPLGQTTVDGRACATYRVADTTQTGERIEIILALGADDLPCSLETRAGGQATTTVFTYNLPLTIEAPSGATPIVGRS